tara:strand:- start:367 stop:780 length:414 start_codon:yes stop_codon:yes gene_type:complete
VFGVIVDWLNGPVSTNFTGGSALSCKFAFRESATLGIPAKLLMSAHVFCMMSFDVFGSKSVFKVVVVSLGAFGGLIVNSLGVKLFDTNVLFFFPSLYLYRSTAATKKSENTHTHENMKFLFDLTNVGIWNFILYSII